MKVEIQDAVLASWASHQSNIKLVVFTESEFWKQRCQSADVTWSSTFA